MTEHQMWVLKMIADGTGRVSARTFNELCGNAKTVRAMFRDGLVRGDGLPAVYVEITPRGHEALASQ